MGSKELLNTGIKDFEVKYALLQDLMSDEEITTVRDFISILNNNQSLLGPHRNVWAEVEKQYANEQAKETDMPNTRNNVVVSTIEGMLTQIVDREISCTTQGVGPEDDQFAQTARTGLEWVLRSNKLRKKIEIHERRRLKFGVGWLKVVFDEKYAGGFGLAKIIVPPVDKIYIDSKIKDVTRLQEAEFIAETINFSKAYAREVYGDDKAAAIDYGYNEFRSGIVFQEEYSTPDDQNGWTMVQWWSKCKGELRLQEFSACGVLLYDSFKVGTRTDNQAKAKYKEEGSRSFYKYTDDYPYFLTLKYIQEGHLYGFGDGKLLISLQNLLNELYDKIRIQMRPNLIAVDDQSDIDIDNFDDNSFTPVHYSGARMNGRAPIHSIPWGSVNRDMYELLDRIKAEVQRICRYSDLMTGQGKSADTATEAAIQQQQGNSHINHEKGNIEETLADVAKYCLRLMMEFSKTGKSLLLNNDEKEYGWVDFRSFTDIPAQKPATASFTKKATDRNPGMTPPKYENVEDENGEPVTKNLDLDIYINVGSGLPKNPAFLWSMLEKMSQLAVVDTNEQPPTPKPIVNWSEMRKFVKQFLGFPIVNDDQMKKFAEEFKKIQLENMKKNMTTGAGKGQLPGAAGGAPGGMPPEAMSMGPGPQGMQGGGNQPAMQPETAGLTNDGGGGANPANVGGIRTGG